MLKLSWWVYLFVLIISERSFAISFDIIGACSSHPIYSGAYNEQDLSINIGQISLNIFNEQNIPYSGTIDGITSIANSAIGLDALEVLTDSKMRAYGWCYSVNNIISNQYASQTFFKDSSDKLIWFYAYSSYDSGNWTEYCVPAYKIKSKQFCK